MAKSKASDRRTHLCLRLNALAKNLEAAPEHFVLDKQLDRRAKEMEKTLKHHVQLLGLRETRKAREAEKAKAAEKEAARVAKAAEKEAAAPIDVPQAMLPGADDEGEK